MITPMMLHKGVCGFLEKEVVPGIKLKGLDPDGNEILKNPKVIRSGWVLPASVDDEWIGGSFPYIMPRIGEVENTGTREAVLTLDIIFGVYGPASYDDDGKLIDDGSGHTDLWNLIETVRQALFSQHTIERRYRILEEFFQAKPIPEDIEPYWEGYCRTKWHIAYPLPGLGNIH